MPQLRELGNTSFSVIAHFVYDTSNFCFHLILRKRLVNDPIKGGPLCLMTSLAIIPWWILVSNDITCYHPRSLGYGWGGTKDRSKEISLNPSTLPLWDVKGRMISNEIMTQCVKHEHLESTQSELRIWHVQSECTTQFKDATTQRFKRGLLQNGRERKPYTGTRKGTGAWTLNENPKFWGNYCLVITKRFCQS